MSLFSKEEGPWNGAEMTLKEVSRQEILSRKKRKEISLIKASEEINLSYKQTKRLWKRYQK